MYIIYIYCKLNASINYVNNFFMCLISSHGSSNAQHLFTFTVTCHHVTWFAVIPRDDQLITLYRVCVCASVCAPV